MGGAASVGLRDFKKQLTTAKKLHKKGFIGEPEYENMRKKAMADLESATGKQNLRTQQVRLQKIKLDKIKKLLKYKMITKEEAQKQETECIRQFNDLNAREASSAFTAGRSEQSTFDAGKQKLRESKKMFEAGLITEEEFTKLKQDFVDSLVRSTTTPAQPESNEGAGASKNKVTKPEQSETTEGARVGKSTKPRKAKGQPKSNEGAGVSKNKATKPEQPKTTEGARVERPSFSVQLKCNERAGVSKSTNPVLGAATSPELDLEASLVQRVRAPGNPTSNFNETF